MNLNNIRLENSYHVAVYPNDSATNLQWQFPDIPTLRDRKTIALQMKLCTVDVNTNKINHCLSVATKSSNCGFVTLIDNKGNAFIQNLPMLELNTTLYSENGGTTPGLSGDVRNANGLFVMAPKYIAWSKCFLYFPTATGINNLCALFNVYYI